MRSNLTRSAKSTGDLPPEASIPEGAPPLESVLFTDELRRPPRRPPDNEKETRALLALASALAKPRSDVLQILTDTILDVIQCDSSGLSLLSVDDDWERVRW